ncbi:hypothetical protein DYH09_06365 [bacterium CPR1]|nr:hypothetical protein [bacterium CPR1]
MIASESIELPLARAATASSASWLESVSHHYGAVKVDAGILLGSTRVHIETRGKAVVQPSRVAVDPRGKVLAVGEVAERMEGREPTEVRVLHPVREGAVVEPELARQLVSRLLSPGAHLAAAIAGDLSAVERAALQSVLLSAGARQVYQVDQAVLASVGAGQRLLQPEACLVVHLGCETTEMAVFALGSRLWGTTLRWGTSHMDWKPKARWRSAARAWRMVSPPRSPCRPRRSARCCAPSSSGCPSSCARCWPRSARKRWEI